MLRGDKILSQKTSVKTRIGEERKTKQKKEQGHIELGYKCCINPSISIITLNASGLNIPIKRDCQVYIQTRSNYMLSIRNQLYEQKQRLKKKAKEQILIIP